MLSNSIQLGHKETSLLLDCWSHVSFCLMLLKVEELGKVLEIVARSEI